MPTKISKVAKDLNVGVNTAVEFLRKHNIEVEDNPNARINDAAVELLVKEYSKDKDFKEQLNKYTTTRKEEKKTAVLVTHDISEAISMSDRIIVLTKRPAQVFKEHTLLFDASLTPISRREKPEFSKLFDVIWKELCNA